MVRPAIGNGEWGIEPPIRTDIAGPASATVPAPRPDRAASALSFSDSFFPIPLSRL
ncbi:hypothetical protein BN444_04233 [Xanthomonas translucens pv. translucens DSM 18974]|uniref:Uncharacterized protein n=1 Tax=Xanthomonas translucens pv. translucens DSM 18974 TaxID=1261556 RepID=A0A1C3TJS1_XANCT|nr:hypothetical protein BN444_04233 [Xanthomonas translucens pv. translucens DSM 18974]